MNGDAYPFMTFSDMTCHLGDTGIKCFLVALCCLIELQLNMEVVTKRLPHQKVKIQV